MTQQIEHQPHPYTNDPYADERATFPHGDLNEVRPFKGSGTLRRARAGWLIVSVVGGIAGFIAWDKMSGSAPAVAQGVVKAFGVGSIPDTKPEPAAVAAAAVKAETAVKEEQKKKGGKPPPPKRGTALGSGDKFENPSQAYAAKEVASWNSSSERKNYKNEIAKRRNSALGN